MADRRGRMAAGSAIAIGTFTVAALVAAVAAPNEIASISGAASANAPAVRASIPGPTLAGCPVFPADNAWNTDISTAALHPRSAAIIDTIQSVGSDDLHPDFGEDPGYGIPFVVVTAAQPAVPITYAEYGDESDPGPFPIPVDAPVEGGPNSDGDRHVLVLQQGSCQLYELYRAFPGVSGWGADGGARWDLTTGALRPIGWTSADAAGLPILPGLVRYDEVASGAIHHAIRVTFSQTQRGFILPATHFASSRTNPDLPAMGLRLRLKADYDISRLTGQAEVIATALQHYGFIVADNGSNWYFQGGTDLRWDDDQLSQLKSIPGTAFEVVDTGPVRTG